MNILVVLGFLNFFPADTVAMKIDERDNNYLRKNLYEKYLRILKIWEKCSFDTQRVNKPTLLVYKITFILIKGNAHFSYDIYDQMHKYVCTSIFRFTKLRVHWSHTLNTMNENRRETVIGSVSFYEDSLRFPLSTLRNAIEMHAKSAICSSATGTLRINDCEKLKSKVNPEKTSNVEKMKRWMQVRFTSVLKHSRLPGRHGMQIDRARYLVKSVNST